MIRSTSIEVYKQIAENGLLSAKRWEVYATVYNHGPMTSAEAFSKINEGNAIKNISQSRARFTELREMGLLKELGQKICSITNNNVILWDVTDSLPTKLEKPVTKTETLNQIISDLEKTHLLVLNIFESKQVMDHIEKCTNRLKDLL